MKTILRALYFLFFCILLTSCASKLYTPPKSYKGTQCISQCNSSKQICDKSFQKAKIEAEQAKAHERKLRDQDKNYVRKIIDIPVYQCVSQYDVCYRVCGGNIRLV